MDGKMDDGRRVITIAHPEPAFGSGELKIYCHGNKTVSFIEIICDF